MSRFFVAGFSLLVFAVSIVHASDLKVTVLDPHSAAVASASLTLFRAGAAQAQAKLTTSAEGTAAFSGLGSESYELEVLAPGFSAQRVTVDPDATPSLVVHLTIAAPQQVVVVSATRTPLALEQSATSLAVLDSDELNNQNPISGADVLRFLPGAIVSTSGQTGGLVSLFTRGGESIYTKVIVDGVPVNEPGGTFNYGVLGTSGVDRLEYLRGAQSTLYGSDAMTGVVQLWTASGRTSTPELTFGADGGNFSTAHGYASLAGVYHRLDYNLFADQFNTEGHEINDDYSESLAGANLGYQISPKLLARLRLRHLNSRTGVQGEWNFNGQPLLPPDADQKARQNDLLASLDLDWAASARWQHRITGYEYSHRRLNQDTTADRGCDLVNFVFVDCPFNDTANFNRAGLLYQGDFAPNSLSHTTFGYEFEDENGAFDSSFLTLDLNGLPFTDFERTRGLRRNHAVFAQHILTWGRLSFITGLRYVHNESFGDRAVPRAALSFLLLRGGEVFSGTRLRFAYGEGIKEPKFEQSFGITGESFPTVPNPNLKPEQNRSLEGGFEQSFDSGKYSFTALYFNNLFRNQIDFETFPCFCKGEYVNVNRALAHGAELEFHARPRAGISLDAAYNFVPTQILQDVFDPTQQGLPLLRRPKHSGSLLVNYTGRRWGAELGGSFIGPRRDSDFFVAPTPITRAAGYVRFDASGWYAVNHYLTAYANIENLFNKQYEEVVGYPALGISIRAGMRIRLGGD